MEKSQTNATNVTGWQMLRDRGTGGARKVRVFYERKNPQHKLFCPETYIVALLKGFRRALNESHPAFALINTNVNKHLVWILTEREWYISVFWWRLVSNEHC